MRGKKPVRNRKSLIGAVRIESLENRQMLAVDFSIATITDTQYEVENFPQNFVAKTQWIANDPVAATYNIKFVSHQGDMLRRGYSNFQAANADQALDLLDGKVPYTVAMGNHDYDNQFDDLDHHISSANFTSWFGDARYQAVPGNGFGGSSLDQRNRYHIFTGGGQQFLVLNLEFEAPDAAIAWGQSVIDAHRNLPTILTTHAYLNNGGRRTSVLDPGVSNSGEQIFQKLVKLNPQIFMVLCGHTGAVYSQVSLNDAGSAVYEIEADFEGSKPNGGNGWMQLISFDLAGGSMTLQNYSPVENAWASVKTFSGIDFAGRFAFAPAGAPIANNDTLDLLPAGSLTFDVRGNDANGSAALVTPGALPAGVVQNGDGAFTYTPGAFIGNVSFTYTIDNGAGVSNAATATLRVNAAPVGLGDSTTTPDGKSVTINVLANDTDDSGDLAALTPILASLPPNGAVFANADKTFTYTPDPRFAGADSFTYLLSDGKTTSGPYSVNVTVTPSAPIYNYPIAETTTYGTRTGTFANLSATDGVEEKITEVMRSGNDAKHVWQFNVTGGTDVMVCINAHGSWGADEWDLKYSTTSATSNFLDMIKLVPGSSLDVTRMRYEVAEPYQMWALPAATRGNVWIQLLDTSTSDTTVETFTVDELFIRNGADTTAPTAPTNLAVTGVTARSVSLAWNAATDNVGVLAYDIYRIDPAGPILMGNSIGTTFTVTGLAASTSYEFYAVARDAAGNISTPSNTISATTSDLVAPAAPSNLTAKKLKNRKVQLNWTDNSSVEQGFHVWSSRDGKTWTLMATVAANIKTYTTGTLAGGAWQFRVTSYSDVLDSTPSNVVTVSL